MKKIIIRNKSDINNAIKWLSIKRKYVSVDFETTGLIIDDIDFRVLSCAFGDENTAFVFPIHHKDSWLAFDDSYLLLEKLSKHSFLAHNFKFEARIMMYLGFDIPKFEGDTMLITNLLDETAPKSLDYLVETYLPKYSGYWNLLHESMSKKNAFETAPIELLLDYNADDIIMTARLYNILLKELDKYPKLVKYWNNYYKHMVIPIVEMEHVGFCMDINILSEVEVEYNNIITEIENTIKHKHITYFKDKPDFNFNSHDQKRHFLYRHLKLPVLQTTKKNRKTGGGGNPATDEKTLEMLQGMGYEPKTMELLIRREKAYTQVKSFINVFKKRHELSLDHFIRTNFNMHTVETGRLSSSKPNLQNLTTSAKLNEFDLPPIKRIFKSRFNNGKLLSADYSQIELRMVAIYSQDTNFVKAYTKDGVDLHGELAEQIYGKDYTKHNRDMAKRTNFSAIFDITANTLSKNLKITKNEADSLLYGFRQLHPELYDWFDDIWIHARERGYLENYNGRRRHIQKELDSAIQEWEFEAIKREVWNFPIQSSASEITLTTLIHMYNFIKERGLKSIIFGSVHDSILFDCPNMKELKLINTEIKQFASNQIPKLFKWIGKIKIKMETEYGNTLHNMEEL